MTDVVPSVAALGEPDQPGSLVVPAAGLADIERAFIDYTKLCGRLLEPADYQRIGSREFRKKSAWRKLAVAFGVSCSYLERNYERDEQGRITAAEIVVRATAPNGRYMDGIGLCSIHEKNFSNPYHDIPATAATRATNRACADLFGMGEVSAEEVVEQPTPPPPPAKRRIRQVGPPGMTDPTLEVDTATGEVTVVPDAPDLNELDRVSVISEMFALFKTLTTNEERGAYDEFRTGQGINPTKKGRDYTLEEATACRDYLRDVVERPF